jgi:hypothetical protein
MSGLNEEALPLLHALAQSMLEEAAAHEESAAEDPKTASALRSFKLKDHYGLISLAPYANSFSGTSFVRWIVLRKSKKGVRELMEHALTLVEKPSDSEANALAQLQHLLQIKGHSVDRQKLRADLQAAELIGKWMRKEELIVHVELEQCFKAKRHLFYRFTTSETDQYQEVLRFGQEAPYRVNCTFLAWAVGAIAVLTPYFVLDHQAIVVLPLAYVVVLTSCILLWTPPELLQEKPSSPQSLLARGQEWLQGKLLQLGQGQAVTAAPTVAPATGRKIVPGVDGEGDVEAPKVGGPNGSIATDRANAIQASLDETNQYTGCCVCGHKLWQRFTKHCIVEQVKRLLNGESSVSQTVSKFFGVYDDVRTKATVPWVGLLLLFGMALLAYMLPITLALMKHQKYATCHDLTDGSKYELTTTYSRCTVETNGDKNSLAWMNGLNINYTRASDQNGGWEGPAMVSTIS